MLTQPVIVSAPGKVILFGEHSVVYGKRSVAFSLGLRTELTLSPASQAVELHLPEIGVEQLWPLATLKRLWEKLKKRPGSRDDRRPQPMTGEEEVVLRAFLGVAPEGEVGKSELGLLAFLHLYTTILSEPVPFSIGVKSQMPIGSGLGSSAAYGVCLAGALLWVSGQLASPPPTVPDATSLSKACLSTVSDWAFCCERILHGDPSGIDNAICTFGGGLSFKAGRIEQQLHPPPLTIMLVNTRVPRNTKSLVAGVRAKYDRLVPVMEPVLQAMDSLADSGLQTLNEMKANGISGPVLEKKFSHLGELIDINQCLLSALEVSHPSLDELVAVAKKHGLHAKLTGAGGGGFGLVLVPPGCAQKDVDSCKEALEAKGFEAWVTILGSQGLTFAASK